MIKGFRHKGLRVFFENGTTKGIQVTHASRLRRQLARLDEASRPNDMNVPGWGLHPLKGNLKGHGAVSVSGNWRMTFSFDDGDAVLVDYQDYH